MRKITLSEVGLTFQKNDEGTWQYEIAPGRMCGANVRTYLHLEKLLRTFKRAPKLVFEIMTEGFRGPVRRLGLTRWEADFADRMVRRNRPYTEKQKKVMKQIIAEMMQIKDNVSVWNFLVPAELEGTTQRKRLLRHIWKVEDIRKLNDEEIVWLEKEWEKNNQGFPD